MSRGAGTPRIVGTAGTSTLERVPLTERLVDESWLQELMFDNPGLLPIDDIGSAWGPLVAVGREIPMSVGFIDNLFVSPEGELTIVEAKLWRNPQARREVVGQVLDYAAALSSMSYDDLDRAVAASGSDASMWKAVCAAGWGGDETAFVDTVSRNLKAGRFLLLIVGDGIRSDVESLAGLLGGHPNLAFHLELVELALYRMPGLEDVLVVPSVIARTAEVTRAIIDITVNTAGDVEVVVEAPAESEGASSRRTMLPSMEAFREILESTFSQARADASMRLIDWWIQEMGGTTTLNMKSVGLLVPYRHNNGKVATVAAVSAAGHVEFAKQSLSDWWQIVDSDEADRRARAAGFEGKVKLFNMTDLSVQHNDRRVRELLAWAAEQVAIANEKEAPQS